MARSSHERRVNSLVFVWEEFPKKKNRIQSFVVTKSSRRVEKASPATIGKKRSNKLGGISLLELSTVLLLKTADLIHVDRVELTLGLLLVGRELLIVHGLQANSGVVTNTDNKHAAVLLSALLVLLIREGDVNLWDVVRRVGRRVGVGKHGATVLVDNENTGATVVCCLDGKAAVVGKALAVAIVVRRQAVLFGLHGGLLLKTSAAEEEEDGDQNETEEDKAEKAKHQVDHAIV
jgi:hypothetical protein